MKASTPQQAGYTGVTSSAAGYTGSVPVASSAVKTTSPPPKGAGYDGIIAGQPNAAIPDVGYFPIPPPKANRVAQQPKQQPIPTAPPLWLVASPSTVGELTDDREHDGYRVLQPVGPTQNLSDYPETYTGVHGWLTVIPSAEPNPTNTVVARDWARAQTDEDLDDWIETLSEVRQQSVDPPSDAGMRRNMITLLSERIARHRQYAAFGSVPDTSADPLINLVDDITMNDLDPSTRQDLIDLLNGTSAARTTERKILDTGHRGMREIAENVQAILIQRSFATGEGWLYGRTAAHAAESWWPSVAGAPLRTGGMARPSGAKHPKLRDAIHELWSRGKGNFGNGSSMDAVWWERVTGRVIGKKPHLTKVLKRQRQLQKLLDKGALSGGDRKVALRIINDINRAILGSPERIPGGGGWRPNSDFPNWYPRQIPWAEPTLPRGAPPPLDRWLIPGTAATVGSKANRR